MVLASIRMIRKCEQCGGSGYRGGTVYFPRFTKCEVCKGTGDIISKFIVYRVWRRQMPDRCCPGTWLFTYHTIKARTDKEARSRTKRYFKGYGFSAMSLVAVPDGSDPNVL